jgi:hypothetical protein
MDIAAQIPPAAAEIIAREQELITLCQSRIFAGKTARRHRQKPLQTGTSSMSRFALRYPYLIIVICLITCVVGVTSLVRMPVDLFPPIKIPVVVVATFYSGMPPEQIENDITGQFERMFTLARASTTWNRARSRASASSRSIFSRAPIPIPM